jgi:peptidoglycan hydrolase-like protein with peptidoglycan-binding domain
MFGRTLRRGMRGEDVRELQQLLAQAGLEPGNVDGVFGTSTEAAVVAFQRDNGLAADGAVGPITIEALTRAVLQASAAGVADLVAGVTPAPPRAAKGLSLHIGLNRVDPNAYPGIRVPVLRGCINDANDMRELARAQGFQTSPPLLDNAATSAAVSAAITNAANTLAPGDLFFLTYSGHGSQVPDTTGEEEEGGLDETLVQSDRQFIDDELYALWGLFKPGVRIVVFSDSCHSGEVTRDLLFATEREIGTRQRDLELGTEFDAGQAGARISAEAVEFTLTLADIVSPILGAVGRGGVDYVTQRQITTGVIQPILNELVDSTSGRGAEDVPQQRLLPLADAARDLDRRRSFYRRLKMAAQRALPPTCSVLLISGCQSNQVSLDGRANGLFTETLKRVWAAGNVRDYVDLHARVLAQMPATQTPNLFWATPRDAAFEAQRPLTI